MLSREDNERLTRVGAGTPMGELMRRYWIPAGFSHQIAKPDSPPVRVKLHGRAAGAVPRHAGPRRAARRALPAPHRVAVLRPQRGVRAALRLSRLEIRRRGQLRRPAERAARLQSAGAASRPRPIPASSAAAWSGPTWARREHKPDFPDLEWTLHSGHRTAMPRATSRNATGCRGSKAASTPATSSFLHSGAAQAEMARRADALRGDADRFRLRRRHRPRHGRRRHRSGPPTSC